MRFSLCDNAQTVVYFLRSLRTLALVIDRCGLDPRIGACCGRAGDALAPVLATEDINLKGESSVGKYVLGWILGVPMVVLVVVYLIFR